MKTLITAAIVLALISCSKNKDAITSPNVTVRAVVWSELKQAGTNQLYWKPGILFSKAVIASGTAVVTWYYPAGFINGNASNHYSKTINFNLTGNSNGYFEFSNWQVDYTMQADSIKLSYFTSSGDYNFTILQ